MVKFQSPVASDLYRQIRNRVPQRYVQQVGRTTSHALGELVLNIAKGCNLTCPYCFADAGLYGSKQADWMTRSDAYNFTLEMLRTHPSIRRIKLFGGESFMNVPAIEGCSEATETFLQESGLASNRISIGCVTNMTIYSHRLAQLAQKLNLQITASVDGPLEIHDRYRCFRNGRGSFNRIKTNLCSYRDEGVEIVGIECVYSPAHMDAGISMLDLHNFLIEEFSAPRVILTPLQGSFDDKDKEEEEKFSNWVRECAEQYLFEAVQLREQDKSYKTVMDEQLSLAFSETSDLGWCGLGTTTLTVDVDGAVLPCYTLLYDKPNWQMGVLPTYKRENSLQLESISTRLRAANPRTTDFCSDCDILAICRRCPGGIFASNGRFTGIDPVACAYRIGALEGLLKGWQNALKAE